MLMPEDYHRRVALWLAEAGRLQRDGRAILGRLQAEKAAIEAELDRIRKEIEADELPPIAEKEAF